MKAYILQLLIQRAILAHWMISALLHAKKQGPSEPSIVQTDPAFVLSRVHMPAVCCCKLQAVQFPQNKSRISNVIKMLSNRPYSARKALF